jgi:alpha-mannosidase
MALLRGVNGLGYVTSHTRPETPDYLEIRAGRANVVIFPGGLPFHQRHGGRMLDIILIPEGETTTVFDIALAMDRDNPMQTALGVLTPSPVIATSKGPPHVGATGWLFHVDTPNVALLNLRPAPEGVDAVIARMLECANHGTQVEFRCVRNPQRAGTFDARGNGLLDSPLNGDGCNFEAAPGELLNLRVDF